MSTQNEFQICRLCGYIRNIAEDGKTCPACGAPATSFVAYVTKVSSIRRKILNLEIHPVVVHFTVSYIISTLILLVLSFRLPHLFGINFRSGGLLDFFMLFLPWSVAAGGITGVMHGRLRYKKLRTRFLKTKMVLAISLLVVSILAFVVHFASEGGTNLNFVILQFVLIILAIILVSLLGMLGSKLTCPLVPRGMEKK
jgi:uncharacterized membrane protein